MPAYHASINKAELIRNITRCQLIIRGLQLLFLPLILLFIILVFSSLAVAQSESTVQSTIQSTITKAVELQVTGDYDQSIHLLTELQKTKCPSQTHCLISSTQQKRIKLELARCYYFRQEYELSKDLLEQVLKQGGLPPQVEKNSKALLLKVESVTKKQEQHRLYGSLSLGLGRDSNATIGPEEESLDDEDTRTNQGVGSEHEGGEESHEDRARDITDNYRNTNLNFTYQYQLNPLKSGDLITQALIKSGVYFFSRSYDNIDTSDFSATSFYLEPVLSNSNHWRGALNFRASKISLAGSNLATYYSITPSYSWQQGKLLWEVNGSFTERDYDDDFNSGKEGRQIAFGASIKKQLRETLSLAMRLSYFDFNAEEDYRSYQSEQFSIKAEFQPTAAFNLFSEAKWQHYEYDAVFPLYTNPRNRNNYSFKLGATYKLTRHFDSGIHWSSIKNDENIAQFDYDKKRIEAFFRYRFN